MDEKVRILRNIDGELPSNSYIKLNSNCENPELVLVKIKQFVLLYLMTDFELSFESFSKSLRERSPMWILDKTGNDLESILSIPGGWHFDSLVEGFLNRGWTWYSSFCHNNSFEVIIQLEELVPNFEPLLFVFFSAGVKYENISHEEVI